MSRLGFGMMRLPVKNGDPTDFDYEQLNRIRIGALLPGPYVSASKRKMSLPSSPA